MELIIRQRYEKPVIGKSQHFTEPNQAYSVRQIIDQYSKGELMAKTFNPSDNIDDESYSEEQLENVITFEDEFEAFNHLQENQYGTRKKEHESMEEEESSHEENSAEETSGVSTTDNVS